MELKDKIKNLRKGKYFQEELAALLKVSYVTVSRWENGTMTPTMRYIPKLAEALGTTSSYLLGDTNDPTPTSDLVTSAPDKKEENVQSQSQTKTEDKGMLTYELGNGRKLQVPNTPETAAQFWSIVNRLVGLQLAASPA